MLKHFVEFFYTSKIPVGPEEEEIEERRDSLVKLPKGASGYRFFDREETIVDGELVKDDPCNFSPYLYFGELLSRKDVKKRCGRKSLIYKFMKAKDYSRAVLTGDNTILCVEEDDIVLKVL